ncbi:hypothetical protein P7C70_g674, partial [Phenoliferia sp. Uapishka_3]
MKQKRLRVLRAAKCRLLHSTANEWKGISCYDFGALEDGDLGALLEEGASNDFNDETFGAFDDGPAPVGRDFDFAGTTSRYLGKESAPPPPAHQLQSWQDEAPRQLSPWSTLDADPLLSGGRPAAYSRSPAQQSAQEPPPRAMRTLDDIEAELRSQASSVTPKVAPATAPGRPMTLEQVEAEMLSRARQQPQMQPQQQLPSSPLPPFMPPPLSNPGFGPGSHFPPLGHHGFPHPGFPQAHLHQQQQHQRLHSVGGGPQSFPQGMAPPLPRGPGMPPGMGMGMGMNMGMGMGGPPGMMGGMMGVAVEAASG